MLHHDSCQFCKAPNAYYDPSVLVAEDADKAVYDQLCLLVNTAGPKTTTSQISEEVVEVKKDNGPNKENE